MFLGVRQTKQSDTSTVSVLKKMYAELFIFPAGEHEWRPHCNTFIVDTHLRCFVEYVKNLHRNLHYFKTPINVAAEDRMYY